MIEFPKIKEKARTVAENAEKPCITSTFLWAAARERERKGCLAVRQHLMHGGIQHGAKRGCARHMWDADCRGGQGPAAGRSCAIGPCHLHRFVGIGIHFNCHPALDSPDQEVDGDAQEVEAT